MYTNNNKLKRKYDKYDSNYNFHIKLINYLLDNVSNNCNDSYLKNSSRFINEYKLNEIKELLDVYNDNVNDNRDEIVKQFESIISIIYNKDTNIKARELFRSYSNDIKNKNNNKIDQEFNNETIISNFNNILIHLKKLKDKNDKTKTIEDKSIDIPEILTANSTILDNLINLHNKVDTWLTNQSHSNDNKDILLYNQLVDKISEPPHMYKSFLSNERLSSLIYSELVIQQLNVNKFHLDSIFNQNYSKKIKCFDSETIDQSCQHCGHIDSNHNCIWDKIRITPGSATSQALQYFYNNNKDFHPIDLFPNLNINESMNQDDQLLNILHMPTLNEYMEYLTSIAIRNIHDINYHQISLIY